MAANSQLGETSSDLSSNFSQMNVGPSTAKLAKLDSAKGERKSRKGNGDKQPNPLISPTEKCRVCYEPAARHIHYGAVTCFSCRAFFRRSIQNQSYEAYKCRKQEQCDINLKSRKSCQKCRFTKCLDIGMKSSWVLSEEERHRRFRKHREKKEQQNEQLHAPDSRQNLDDDENNENYDDDRYSNSPMSGHSGGHEPEVKFHQYQMGRVFSSPPPLSPITSRRHLNIQLTLPDMNRSQYSEGVYNPYCAGSQGPTVNVPPSMYMQPHPYHHNPYGPSNVDHPIQGPSSSVHQAIRLSANEIQNSIPTCPLLVKAEPLESPSDEENYVSDDHADEDTGFSIPAAPMEEITADELAQIKAIARLHDINYKSVNFGEELIKEMVMSSVFGVPLSVSATMNAYRLMIQRVTKVAQCFDPFLNLPHATQSNLLKHNADTIVSLRGAVFFEKRKGGLDQILITMGVDDLLAARNMVMTAMKTTELKRIDYQTFNSLQKVGNSAIEMRYNTLLQRVGVTVSFDPDLVKMLSYVLLFSVDFTESDLVIRKAVEETQDSMISMMRRYIFAQYVRPLAVKLFSGLLHCIADLHELTWIKRQRQLAVPATNLVADRVLAAN